MIKKASRVDALKLHDLLLGLGILLPDTAVSTVLAQCGKSGGTLDPPLFFAALEEGAISAVREHGQVRNHRDWSGAAMPRAMAAGFA